ncbi:pentapeptide repeat-containing protein [Aliterella atlantica]|uniref:Low-complexity protein n=1 Tax=Aliterella atlantica CENA595 TaxID=1618023 RepID=A0A0D8ZVZ0_9CYAN|nr:pentapeptide repeat-containing protein [Aliterella atlantica]KJH71386.1 hypothetical protein UH38_12560 [Aliterella atlantica CENA595]
MQTLIQKFSIIKSTPKEILLFDSALAAEDIAYMLGGQWDGCNGVVVDKRDRIAVDTAASLVGATWCYGGVSSAFLKPLNVDQFKKRYAAGERNFVNANLRGAALVQVNLSAINLSWAKLNLADLSGANLSKADLISADLQEANLSGTDLTGANLSMADLRGANLLDAKLELACLRGAKLPNNYQI